MTIEKENLLSQLNTHLQTREDLLLSVKKDMTWKSAQITKLEGGINELEQKAEALETNKEKFKKDLIWARNYCLEMNGKVKEMESRATAAANRKSSSAGVVTESADSTFDVDISELDSESESDTETEAEAFTSTDDGFFSTPAAALLLYTSLILGAHKARKDSVMKRLYGLLHEDGLVPNRPIMTRMVASLPYADDPAGAIELYEYIRHLGIQMDGFMYGHVIAALLVGSESQKWWDTALLLTHRMHMAVAASHDTSVQTSLAVTAGKNGWVSELLQLYRMMIQDGVMPRGITWNACKL